MIVLCFISSRYMKYTPSKIYAFAMFPKNEICFFVESWFQAHKIRHTTYQSLVSLWWCRPVFRLEKQSKTCFHETFPASASELYVNICCWSQSYIMIINKFIIWGVYDYISEELLISSLYLMKQPKLIRVVSREYFLDVYHCSLTPYTAVHISTRGGLQTFCQPHMRRICFFCPRKWIGESYP